MKTTNYLEFRILIALTTIISLNIIFSILKSGHNRANFTDKRTFKDEN